MRITLTAIYLAAAMASASVAIVLLRRRQIAAGLWLALLILAAGGWALGDAFELLATTVAAKRIVSQLQYLFVVTPAPFFFYAAFALARIEHRITGWVRAAVWVIPVMTLAVVWTSSWHDWLWTSVTIPDPHVNLGVYEYGWWFWVFAIHSYILLAIATIVLLAATRRVTRPFRVPFSAVIIAVLLPWLGNVAYVLKLGPVPGLNWFSISILLSGCIFAWATMRGGLLDLLPQARETLVDSMQDGVVVTDKYDRIVYANDAARALLWHDAVPHGVPRELLTSPHDGDDSADASGQASWRGEVELDAASEPRWLDVRVDPVYDRWNETAGRVIVVRDITARKLLEAEKEKLIADLETALGTVRTLEGILPVCAGCRKIKENDDTWSELDVYVRKHTRVAFSHGFCPDCAARLYGDYIR